MAQKSLAEIVGGNVAELRKARGMTQVALAEQLNYSDKAVSKWERGEAMPEVAVLKQIADLFGVSVDYLLKQEHTPAEAAPPVPAKKKHNRFVVSAMSVVLVWLLATVAFVNLDVFTTSFAKWLVFVYAVPVSAVVALVFNSVWGRRRRNFWIIALLGWSVLAALYVTFLSLGHSVWQIFLIGIPGQIILLLWFRLKR